MGLAKFQGGPSSGICQGYHKNENEKSNYFASIFFEHCFVPGSFLHAAGQQDRRSLQDVCPCAPRGAAHRVLFELGIITDKAGTFMEQGKSIRPYWAF